MVDSAGKIKMSDPKNGPDKGSSAQFKRTVKTYCCIALGKPIVTSDWLNNSKVAKSFSGLQLRKMISQLSNIMSSIYSQHWNWPKKKPMLTGFKIHVTEGVKPPPTEMKDIIQCAGAKVSAVLIF
ncbi:Mediator of DNA damage checkpoint protein 1 [Nymphon striatum]|nr:Mediator of DNA damage checkpoint protein 1 [Nymphon striatum]